MPQTIRLKYTKNKVLLTCCVRTICNYPEDKFTARELSKAARIDSEHFYSMLDDGVLFFDAASTKLHEATFGMLQSMELNKGTKYEDIIKDTKIRSEYCQCTQLRPYNYRSRDV